MSHHPYSGFERARQFRYLVRWSLHWQVLEARAVEPCADLRAAFTEAMSGARTQGWEPEGEGEFGFVFLRRAHERCLLMLTPRNPNENGAQSFNPYKPSSA